MPTDLIRVTSGWGTNLGVMVNRVDTIQAGHEHGTGQPCHNLCVFRIKQMQNKCKHLYIKSTDTMLGGGGASG
jgi:hypothetical protein